MSIHMPIHISIHMSMRMSTHMSIHRYDLGEPLKQRLAEYDSDDFVLEVIAFCNMQVGCQRAADSHFCFAIDGGDRK